MQESKDKLLHYGIKGMKWDDKFLSDKEDEKTKQKRKDALRKANPKAAAFADKMAKKLKGVKQTVKNKTGITKKESQERKKDAILRKLEPEGTKTKTVNKKKDVTSVKKSLDKVINKLKSSVKTTKTTEVLDLKKPSKNSGFKKVENTPFKNESFQREWKKREEARAKVDALQRKGQLSSKDAKAMKERIDKDTKKNMDRHERNKNVKVTTEVKSIDGKPPAMPKNASSKNKKPSGKKKTMADWAGTTMAVGSKEEKEFNKWVKDSGFKVTKMKTKAERKKWIKEKGIKVDVTDVTINGKRVKGSKSSADMISELKGKKKKKKK